MNLFKNAWKGYYYLALNLPVNFLAPVGGDGNGLARSIASRRLASNSLSALPLKDISLTAPFSAILNEATND